MRYELYGFVLRLLTTPVQWSKMVFIALFKVVQHLFRFETIFGCHRTWSLHHVSHNLCVCVWTSCVVLFFVCLYFLRFFFFISISSSSHQARNDFGMAASTSYHTLHQFKTPFCSMQFNGRMCLMLNAPSLRINFFVFLFFIWKSYIYQIQSVRRPYANADVSHVDWSWIAICVRHRWSWEENMHCILLYCIVLCCVVFCCIVILFAFEFWLFHLIYIATCDHFSATVPHDI